MRHSVPLGFAQIAELCHEIEDRDDALAKAREAAHKAQMQKYQVSFVFSSQGGTIKTFDFNNIVSCIFSF